MKTHAHFALCIAWMALPCTMIVAGCGRPSADGSSSSAVTEVSTSAADAAKYVLAEEPDGAVGVIAARDQARDGDEIVLIGRIGGSKKPWIEGRAAFMVIDASMSVVGDGEESGVGEICLDECCAALRAECTTLVKLVDEQGRVLSVDGRRLLNAAVDDLVVIHGHVQRDQEEGTFVVVADGVHVRR